eukprot:10049945-Alexandrium_andersonii.AAC.1
MTGGPSSSRGTVLCRTTSSCARSRARAACFGRKVGAPTVSSVTSQTACTPRASSSLRSRRRPCSRDVVRQTSCRPLALPARRAR